MSARFGTGHSEVSKANDRRTFLTGHLCSSSTVAVGEWLLLPWRREEPDRVELALEVEARLICT